MTSASDDWALVESLKAAEPYDGAAHQVLVERFRAEQGASVHLETARFYPHFELVRFWGWREERQGNKLPTGSSVSFGLRAAVRRCRLTSA